MLASRTDSAASIVELYEPIRDDLSEVQAVFDEEIRSEYEFVNVLCDTVRSYRGKMLRPALLLLSGRASGELTPAHHTLGAVVEMVHMATLVHDDILDDADERRKKPTIRKLAGNTSAVLLGDYLISHAFHLCSGLDDQTASRRIGSATNTVCEGELLQNAEIHNVDLSEEVYFEIVRRKTGALTAVACELGATFAGACDEWVTGLSEFGMSTGIAFQIVDDILDIVGNQAEVGKSLGIDAALGKPTLPAIHCLAHGNRQQAETIRACLNGSNQLDQSALVSIFESSGSLDYAMNTARRFISRGIDGLSQLPDSPSREALANLAEFIAQRRW